MGIRFSEIKSPKDKTKATEAIKSSVPEEKRETCAVPEDAQRLYHDLIAFCRELWEKITRKEEGVKIEEIQEEVGKVIRFFAQPEAISRFEEVWNASYSEEDYFSYHSAHVAILAILIGLKMGYQTSSVVKLGIASLLHDIGMHGVSSEIIFKNGRLTSKEFEQVKKHPEHAQEMLKDIAWVTEEIMRAIYQEHERYDGSGYPNNRKDGDVNEWAGIIGLADTFEALTHWRSYRKSGKISPGQAVAEIIQNDKPLFDKKVLKAFLSAVSLYPIGTWVKLNTGEMAMVIRCNPDCPSQPEIRILVDIQGKKSEPVRTVDLSRQNLYFIRELPDEEGVKKITECITHTGN